MCAVPIQSGGLYVSRFLVTCKHQQGFARIQAFSRKVSRNGPIGTHIVVGTAKNGVIRGAEKTMGGSGD